MIVSRRRRRRPAVCSRGIWKISHDGDKAKADKGKKRADEKKGKAKGKNLLDTSRLPLLFRAGVKHSGTRELELREKEAGEEAHDTMAPAHLFHKRDSLIYGRLGCARGHAAFGFSLVHPRQAWKVGQLLSKEPLRHRPPRYTAFRLVTPGWS